MRLLLRRLDALRLHAPPGGQSSCHLGSDEEVAAALGSSPYAAAAAAGGEAGGSA